MAIIDEIDEMASSADGLLSAINGRAAPRRRLRLVKILVQPVFVLDDGETLTEQIAQPREFPAAQWPEPAVTQIEQGIAQVQAQVEAGG